MAAGLVWISADTRLRQFDLEDTEVAQFYVIALGKCLDDMIQRALNHVEHLVLNEAGFIADAYYDFAFGECAHSLGNFEGMKCWRLCDGKP